MKRSASLIALFVFLAAGPGADGGRAQYTALPVHYSANADPELKTIMLYTDYLVAEKHAGPYRPLAGKVVLNLGRLNFSGGAGVLLDSELDTEISLGAAAGLDLYFVSPSLPTVTFQVAAGYTDVGDGDGAFARRWDVPLGAGFTFYLPAFDWLFEPWIAPRLHARFLERREDFGFGASAGLSVTHAHGPGLHLAADVLLIDDPATGKSRAEFTFSGGVHIKFVLP